MTILHDNLENGGRFYLKHQGKMLGMITYTRQGENLVSLDHTEVDDSQRGLGTGRKILEEAIHWARKNGQNILPTCPFVKHEFDKNPEWEDVLAC